MHVMNNKNIKVSKDKFRNLKSGSQLDFRNWWNEECAYYLNRKSKSSVMCKKQITSKDKKRFRQWKRQRNAFFLFKSECKKLDKNNCKIRSCEQNEKKYHHFEQIPYYCINPNLFPQNIEKEDKDEDEDKENFEFENETIQLNTAPGHTSGHVFDSVKKIKNLPDETKIFCGHEYTASNSKFCIAYDKENKNLIKRIDQIKKLRSQNLPTIPTTVLEEKANNIFFRSDNEQVISNIGMNGSDEVEIFKKLRELKDNF